MKHEHHALHQTFVRAVERAATETTAQTVAGLFDAIEALLVAHCACMRHAAVVSRAGAGAGDSYRFARLLEDFTPIIQWLVDHPLPESPGVDRCIATGGRAGWGEP